jgi:hypothetical protein
MPISPPAADPISSYGIAALAWAVAALWAWLFGRGSVRRMAILAAGALVVFGASGAAATSGVLQRFDTVPPPMALMIVSVFTLAFALGLSPFGGAAAMRVPVVALVLFQGFRFPLELVMHHAADTGVMPRELSYSGYNFDIVTGAGALLLGGAMAAGAHVPRAAIWIWNLWGCWCLAVIVFIAIASSPMVRLWGGPPHVNTWVLFVPYVWLPMILVTTAVFGHIVITRALLARRAPDQ